MRAGTPATSNDLFMYWAVAHLPPGLPRSAIVTAPLGSGAGETPVRAARFLRTEASSISADTASATVGGFGFEPSEAARAVVFSAGGVVVSAGCVVLGALLALSSPIPQPTRATT